MIERLVFGLQRLEPAIIFQRLAQQVLGEFYVSNIGVERAYPLLDYPSAPPRPPPTQRIASFTARKAVRRPEKWQTSRRDTQHLTQCPTRQCLLHNQPLKRLALADMWQANRQAMTVGQGMLDRAVKTVGTVQLTALGVEGLIFPLAEVNQYFVAARLLRAATGS